MELSGSQGVLAEARGEKLRTVQPVILVQVIWARVKTGQVFG